MFCYNCRQELADGTAVCPACGAAQNQGAAAPAAGAAAPVIPNHLVGAILATLFCCLPFGIVAIVYASGVNGKIAAGDIAGAQAASQKASTWINVSVICGIIGIILNVILHVVAASGHSQSGQGRLFVHCHADPVLGVRHLWRSQLLYGEDRHGHCAVVDVRGPRYLGVDRLFPHPQRLFQGR